jgi:hypothetical protein
VALALNKEKYLIGFVLDTATSRSMTVLGLLVLIPLFGGERACRVGVVAA